MKNELTDEQIDELQAKRNADYHAGKITDHRSYARAVIAAHEALQAGQEPYAWCVASKNSADWAFAGTEDGVKENALFMDEDCIKTQPFPLYTAPPPAPDKDAEIAALKAEIKLDSEAWAELHTLRLAVKGPDGFDTWQAAAVAERVKRVKAEAEVERLSWHRQDLEQKLIASDAIARGVKA